MNFFNYYIKDDSNKLNVYKELEFNNLDMKSYNIYKITEDDNLMNISHKFYGTIDDWWTIYLFNRMDSLLTSLPNDSFLFNIVDEIDDMVTNYNTLVQKDKNKIFTMVFDYFRSSYDVLTSIEKTNSFLTLEDLEERYKFKDYLFDYFLYYCKMNGEIKIPSLNNIYKMKQSMNNYNTIWSNINE